MRRTVKLLTRILSGVCLIAVLSLGLWPENIGYVGAGILILLLMVFVVVVLDIVRDCARWLWAIRPKRITHAAARADNRCPPQFAEYLLYFLPKKDREPLLGDLEEEYREIYRKFGTRKANVWYSCQVGMSFWPYIALAIKKLVGWGAVGWIGNWIRRLVQ